MSEKTTFVGQNVLRTDAYGKVTGQADYTGDIDLPGQLWMKILFSDRPHARITQIETTAAEAYPGVKGVFTAKDIPVNEYGLQMYDQPVLCGPGGELPGTDVVRCYADQVAVVVADTEDIAAHACTLIDVIYEDLPPLFDAYAAMAAEAPQLHHDAPGNVISHFKIRKGDMDAGWAEADVIVEGEYITSWQEHAYLQPEAGLSYIDEQGCVTVVVGGQHSHKDQQQIAHALNLPLDRVRVIYPAIGGAFGGREDMSVQIVLALATLRLQQPVKTIWSREESIRYHHKRHPITIKAKWGATKEGKVVAVWSEVVGDAGAYNYTSNKVLGNANLCTAGPYEIPNVHFDTYAIYTNNVPSGAFRGFGGPQGAFAAEQQMNKLAEALGMDPVEIRERNLLTPGSLMIVGTPLPDGESMMHVARVGAEQSYWQQSNELGWQREPVTQPVDPAKRRGIGFAVGFKNVGFSFGYQENCTAIIELRGDAEIEEAVLYHAAAEVGQGVHTIMQQMVADAVHVPIEKVRLIASDTSTSRDSGSVSASRMTLMAGNSIRGAAQKALEEWENEERPAIAEYKYLAPKTTKYHKETGHSRPNFAYGYVSQAVEVEVDIETGHIHLRNVVCADDVGKAINPMLVQGQVEGAVVQAAGYAIMEELVVHEGRIQNPYFSTYLIPTISDIPDAVETIIVEDPTPTGPWGARGVGEMPYLPLVPAITDALHDATGIWFDEIPLTPQRVVAKLREHGIGADV